MFPDERVVQAITQNFIPARAHIKDQKPVFERFGAHWTPTQLILTPSGAERYRVEGFLPVEDFLAQLELGLARIAFESGKFQEAQQRYQRTCDQYSGSVAAPEACYWAGVAAYKATNRGEYLKETANLLDQRYPGTEWARKSSVWKPKETKSQAA